MIFFCLFNFFNFGILFISSFLEFMHSYNIISNISFSNKLLILGLFLNFKLAYSYILALTNDKRIELILKLLLFMCVLYICVIFISLPAFKLLILFYTLEVFNKFIREIITPIKEKITPIIDNINDASSIVTYYFYKINIIKL